MKPKTTPPESQAQISVARVEQFIKSRFNPIRNLDPETLARYLDEFKCGYLRNCALTWDSIMERDDMLLSVESKRRKSVARKGWDILVSESIADSKKTEAQRHRDALLYFYNNLSVTNAIDGDESGEVSLLIRQMMSAVGMRYAAHEIQWRPGVSGLSAALRFVPLWFFERTTGKLRFLQQDYAMAGVALVPESWLITVADGLMAGCSVAYMYKNMSLKDWVIYNRRHGMPGIHGKTAAAEGSDEWDELVTAVSNFASEWALVTNSGATIDKIDMSTAGQLPYPPLVERMDRAMAAIWRGADLSTISAGVGAGQGASVQADETALLEDDDAQLISETLNRQIDRRVLEYAFGPGTTPLAYFKIKTSSRKNVELELKVDAGLRSMGLPMSEKSLAERYDRPLPAAGENILPAPAAPVVPSFPNCSLLTDHCLLPNNSPAASLPAATKAGGNGISGPSPVAAPTPAADLPAGPLSNSERLSVSSEQSRGRRADHPAVGRLLAAARDEFAQAQASVLAPLRQELERIMALPDAEVEPALRGLSSALPSLLKQMNLAPETAKVLEDTLAAALVNGMESGSQQ